MNAPVGRLLAGTPLLEPRARRAAGGANLQVGLMTLGAHQVALPAANIREVVPCPPVLTPGLSPASACLGSVIVRGTAIPVLALAALLEQAAPQARDGVIVIIQNGERLAGVLVDAVSGLARLKGEQIQPCLYPEGSDMPIVSHVLVLGEKVASLLDPEALLRLPGVPYASDASVAAQTGTAIPRRGVVLMRAAGADIAIDASRFVATVPNVALRSSPVPSSSWAGVVDYLGQEVPVVDDLSLLGLSGRTPATGSEPVVILRVDDQHLLGLKIERVRRIQQVAEEEIHPLEDALAGRLKLFCGTVADAEGRQSLLLDQDALERSEALRMLGRLSVKEHSGPAVQTRLAKRSGGRRRHYLVFRAGETYHACDLQVVGRIISFPELYSPLDVPGSALLGVATHEGRPLPLLDCGGESRTAVPDFARASVLVVPIGEAIVGLVVDALENVTRAVAQDMPGPPHGPSSVRFVEVRADGRAMALPVLDAQEKARQLAALSRPCELEDVSAERLLLMPAA